MLVLNTLIQKLTSPFILFILVFTFSCQKSEIESRERISINEGWHFFKYDSVSVADDFIYDIRPAVREGNAVKYADSKPTEAAAMKGRKTILKPWILPTANPFILNTEDKYIRPEGNPGADFPFVQADLEDRAGGLVDLPHDGSIKGPVQTGWDSEVGGGMGRLPVNGVAWYRKKLDVTMADKGKSIILEIDGAQWRLPWNDYEPSSFLQ